MRIPNKAQHPHRHAGFTLIEGVVALAVAAVLAAVGAPTMGRVLAINQLATAQLELIASLQHARYQAISSGRRALLCPSTDGVACIDSTHWEGGWALGSYRSNRADQLDGPPTRVQGNYARVVIVSTEGRKRVRFQPDGTAGGSMVTFTLCRRGHAEDALALTVAIGGRVAAAKPGTQAAANCAAAR